MNNWDKDLSNTPEHNIEKLSSPVPLLSLARELKSGYRRHPIDKENLLYDEELVSLALYGIAGQAYYSRPNAATGSSVSEVAVENEARKTLASKLRRINQAIKEPAFTDFFGGAVELYVEDSYRSYELQQKLHEQIFPDLIRKQNPGIADEEMNEKLRSLIAEPSDDPEHPFPHATGGAVDVILRYAQPTLDYVSGTEVPMGHVDGDTSARVLPDYYEQIMPMNEKDELARRNRRAFYAIMTGAAIGYDTDLQVNPTEWWHWSYGDQMWAVLRHQPAALYGAVSAKP